MSPSALIYSHSVSPRLQYLVEFLTQYYGLQFRLVYDEEKYMMAPDACKINYGYHRLAEGEIFIHSHALLFESSIRPVKVECFQKEPKYKAGHSYPVFFRSEGDEGFDLFAAIFYLITRYEEYLPHRKDVYGRYAHENSVAYKEGFLHLPLVNIWLEDFRNMLAERNPAFRQPASLFQFLPTYDIDMAWVFRNKGFRRNAGGIALLLLKWKFGKMLQRWRVARKKLQDPYDVYDWMHAFHTQYGLHPIYFFLVARETGKYDKNTDIHNEEFRELLKDLSSRYETGLHPSWASHDATALLTNEKHTLETITGEKITKSRQHFIRFSLPQTYQKLISAGITDDYSMGYGSINGFRASVASSFYWYDVKAEEKTTLLIHPFCFMDANCYYEQKLTPEAAQEEMKQYFESVKKVNGTLISIWHNSFLGTAPEFRGWREAYENSVALIAST